MVEATALLQRMPPDQLGVADVADRGIPAAADGGAYA